MERYLENRVAIVTGGAGGIGSELVRGLVAAGAAVVVNDYGVTLDGRDPSPGPATKLVEEIEAGGGRAIAHTGSVADHEVAGSLVALAVKAYGRVDAMVTCHGIFSEGSIFDLAEADFDAVVTNHLKGTFNCVQHALVQMRTQRSGSVVCVTSSSGMDGNPVMPHYAAAKAGVTALLKSAALSAGEFGINVNGIIPAAATRVTTRPGSISDLWWKGEKPNSDLSAALTVALVSPQARHITGQVFTSAGRKLARWNQSEEERAEQREEWTVDTVLESLGGLLAGPPLRRFAVYGLTQPSLLEDAEAG